jgi:hypothetical protein
MCFSVSSLAHVSRILENVPHRLAGPDAFSSSCQRTGFVTARAYNYNRDFPYIWEEMHSPDDPMVGKPIGGVIVFGGGLPLGVILRSCSRR